MKRKILKLLSLALPISLISFSASSKTNVTNALSFNGLEAVQIGRECSQDDIEFYCNFPIVGENAASLQISLTYLNFIADEWASAMKIVNNTTAPLTVSLMLTGDNIIKSGQDYFCPIEVESPLGSDVDILISTNDENGASLTLGTVRNSDNPVTPILFKGGFQGRVLLYNCIETTTKNTFDNSSIQTGTSRTYNFVPHRHTETNPPAEKTTMTSCQHISLTEKMCADCGEYEIVEANPALKHQFETTESGQLVCSVCGAVKQECLNHSWVLESTMTQTTCEEDGLEVYVCEVCGSEKIDNIPTPGHDWEEIIDIEPTCCDVGYKHKHCTVCNITTTSEMIPKKEHAYSLVSYIREPTCTEGGTAIYWCSNCQQEISVDLDPLSHSRSSTTGTRTRPASCTDFGYTQFYCSSCNQWVTDESTIIPMLDHEWSDWETLSEGDCEHDRIEERHCTVCEQTERNIVEGEHNYVIKDEVPGTCLHEGYESFICSVCGYEPEEREILDIDPFNHEGIKQLIIDTPATAESFGRGHYEWSCCGRKDYDTPVNIPQLTADNSKDVIGDIIGINTKEPQPGEEKSAVEEALDNISNETLLDVAEEVNKTFGEIAALEGVSEEKKQEYIQTVQAATESAVIAGSKLDNSANEAAAISQKMPENSPIKMDDKLEKFYKLQYELILGKQADPSKSTPMNSPFRTGETNGGGIDYTEGADIYKQVGEFIDNTVGHMTDAASMVRVCSNEKVTTAVNDYIDRIGVKSFRAFDKRAADLEFAANAYKAILVNMQEQSIANLNSSYEELSKELTGVALSDLENEYNAQLEVCNDLEAFEWVIIEIMREKYDSILNSRLEKGEITYDTYVGQFVGDSETDLENFKGIYTNIFYGWALGKDAETYGYTNSYGITLQELTDATISSTTLRQKDMDLSKGPSTSEIVVAVCFGSACLLTVAGLIWVEVLKRRKGV